MHARSDVREKRTRSEKTENSPKHSFRDVTSETDRQRKDEELDFALTSSAAQVFWSSTFGLEVMI